MPLLNSPRFYFTDLISIYTFLAVHLITSYYLYKHLKKDKNLHAVDKCRIALPKWVFPVVWFFANILQCLSMFFVQYRWSMMELWS